MVVSINLISHITKLENRHKSEVSSVISLAFRCWQAYRFLEPEHEMRIELARANHAVIAAHRRNLVHLKLYATAVFIAIEAGHHDSANGMLDKAMAYKSFLKTHEPFYYGVLCFLYAYLELCQKRARSAKKYRRALADHIKTEPPSPRYTVMQGLLHLAAGEYAEAYTLLTDALMDGSNSIFLYEGLYRYYKNAVGGFEGISVLPVLTYAAQRGADIGAVAAKYSETLSAAIAADPEAGEKLYAISKYPPILKDICAARIDRNDMSAEAFAYYRDAEKKQIYTPKLFNALVRAAYENNAQKMNHYPMANFLAGLKDGIEDLRFAVYIYHFLLSDPALSDLLPNEQNRILQLGTRCIENDIQGREANSIYYFMWSRFRALGISGSPLIRAEEILCENLTSFELRVPENSAARYVYITEPEKRGTEVYEIVNNATIINAVCASAGYTCFGAGQRTIIDEDVTIAPMVGSAAPELYLHFFQKGDRRFDLLAYLANYYLQLDAPPDEAAPVFEALLAEKKITKPYRMRILVALGRVHYNAFSFEQALECYGEVDESAIDNDFTEQVLYVYLQTHEYTRAAKLIAVKHKYISNETLFNALDVLLSKSEKDNEAIAEVGYKLLCENFLSEKLLDFVLKYFSASAGEWSALSRIIDENNRSAPNLDARVLESALQMSSFDMNAQRAFARLYEYDNENPLIAEFTELASYEMLANFTRPNYDVLNILEKIFLEKEDVLLAWGIAGIYVRYNITTFKSDQIIRYAVDTMESEGILFPVFKENNLTQVPFIEKFQPFLYKSLPEKDCWLYYRIEGADNFKSVKMQYVKYGLYSAAVPIFYNETFTYYFSEEMASGSITTREETVKNAKPFINENNSDTYFIINNAIINEQMFKHDQVEKLISHLVKEIKPVRARLM